MPKPKPNWLRTWLGIPRRRPGPFRSLLLEIRWRCKPVHISRDGQREVTLWEWLRNR
ncbi:Hypothetical protein, putative [Bodo saltans]|uniref:Uncharacterized protein n=1 Tax=Bodo saltans TaxID=75058 RepID=A0A0S4KPH5_BODSA|nr:Hypothetical protein, putative [Bodo saltans]|eukprot:CUI15541.1 Hypothetical protein, putative [Bodo saltans]